MKRTKLRASAKHHLPGSEGSPTPAFVEIEQDDGGYYLFYLDGAGQYLAHTWHETLDDAKAKAHFDLVILETEWSSVTR